MATAVGVVFSPGGKVYSFDPGGLELGCVVKPNHALESEPSPPLKRVLRRVTPTDEETNETNRVEAKRAMGVFREVLRQTGLEMKPVSAELVFDGYRLVFAYEAEGRPDLTTFRDELRRRLARRVELRSVGPRECARLCGDHGLCGGQHCCRRFPSHEQPITLRMAKDQDLPMSSGRITGLCGRLRCCLAFEHPTYKSFRDRA